MEKYIEPFIAVCASVFKDFLGCRLEAGYPFFVTRAQTQDWDLSALIGLSGEAEGAVALSLKTELALAITGKLTGKTHTYLDEEVIDAVGEIVNIIAGNVKQKLEEHFNLVISLPSIIKGRGHEIIWPGSHIRIMCIPFTLPEGRIFHLSVAISSVKGN
ncbi:MAG: chemotaxis protein CheX [Treponema sp.]|jgi:chemotaxis protein CheX|nr:chemotaxis protein CheX [Treponema sp.]